MAQDERLISDAGLEDSSWLDDIQGMVYARASAVGISFPPIDFEHSATLLDKLEALRTRVYTLAPYFVNMDYPYWRQGWAEFPKMFSTSWHRGRTGEFDRVDDLAVDEEHAIDQLPQNCSSFDDDSLARYRRYIGNLVYWLKKFRYIKALKTWYDRSYRRNWDWVLSWDDNQWQQTSYATVNGVHMEGMTDAELRSVQDGRVWREGPRQIRAAGYIQVPWVERGFMRKTYNYKSSRVDPQPVTQQMEGEHVYNVGDGGDGIPANLTTRNPTGYLADLLWFIVPSSNHSPEHAGKGLLTDDMEDELVTNVEQWSYHRWGPNDEYGAWEYHAVNGSGQYSRIQRDFVNGDFKETYNDTNVWSTPGYNRRSTRTITRTNWTPTGDRSAEVEHYSEQDTSTNQPYDNRRTREYFQPQTFGLVHFDADTRPCFNAGTILPHDSLTYHVCDQDTLPGPSYQFNWDYVPNETYCFGVDDESSIWVDASTLWYPILDLGEYAVPEEPEESVES